MSNSRKKSTHAFDQYDLPLHGSLFGVLDAAANQLAQAIRDSKFSRDQLCDLLKGLLGREVTKAHIDAWTAETNRNRMPADVFVGLCHILKVTAPLNILLAPIALTVANEVDRAFSELGRVGEDRRILNDREMAARRILNQKGVK